MIRVWAYKEHLKVKVASDIMVETINIVFAGLNQI